VSRFIHTAVLYPFSVQQTMQNLEPTVHGDPMHPGGFSRGLTVTDSAITEPV